MMTQHRCQHCAFRSRFDNNPTSILGKFWRWHIKWCPGWKRYLASLPDEERRSIKDKYSL
ncbi:MAG TPA: hypothetical protein VJ936_07540 [Desulfobacteraceae bacterium]|nr:hypothetical protein [Desulfobacteraceae bacterium]